MKFLLEYLRPGLKRRRLIMMTFALVICTLAVAMCRMAGFGVDPFQSLCSGIYNVSPLSEGLTYLLLNGLMLIAVFFFDKHYIHLGTVFNMCFFGYLTDFFQQLLTRMFGMPGMAGRIAYLVLGVLICCVACSLNITADLGVSTYDAIPLHLTAKTKKPYRIVRVICDFICVATGWLLGATVGVTTIITACMLGPMISFFNVRLSAPLLYRGLRREP